ncbi:MAG TPA: hypothetical protein VGY77_00215 [Gemmataceae bacterium]|jgi:hypothetical protein|nr:hypothetical protein [Gemmataceae bacterium]
MKLFVFSCFVVGTALVPLSTASLFGEPIRKIAIDGKFADWKDVPVYKDPPNNEHDTDHSGRNDTPEHIDHADVDILEYKFAHDAENLYAYFKARGVIGRTQTAAPGKEAGRYYAIVTIDVDNDEKTGYWLHEGGFYPTSGGYDVNAEIEWYNGQLNTGHYINHACLNPKELDQAFLDQSSGRYQMGRRGPYQPGFVRLGLGTYKYYTEWVYHDNDTITFVRDMGPRTLGNITGALSPDGHELEMKIPMKGFLKDPKGEPLVKLGRTINISLSLEASGELAKGKRWASNTAAPIRGYVLEAIKK